MRIVIITYLFYNEYSSDMLSFEPLTPSVKQQNIPISLAIGLDCETTIQYSILNCAFKQKLISAFVT